MQERLHEEYENYEPEVSIWPYVLLGFIVPLVPFLSHILLERSYSAEIEGMLFNFLYMLPIASLYFIASYVVRTSRSSVLLIFNGLLYFFITLFYWGSRNINSAEFIYSFGVLSSPAFLAPLSYAFYAKRKRLPGWGTTLLVSIAFLACTILYLFMKVKPTGLVGLISYSLPSLVLLVALLTFFVNRRMESTPPFIMIPLSLAAFLTLLIGNSFLRSTVSAVRFFTYLSLQLISSYSFWYAVSIIVVYQALSHKSSFRNIGINFESKDTEYTEEKDSSADFYPEGYKEYDKDYRTAYPPKSSRFDDTAKESEEEPQKEEIKTPPRERYEERRNDDDYYYDEPRRRRRPVRRVVEYYDDYDDDEYDRRRRRDDERYYRDRNDSDYDDREYRSRSSRVRDLDYEDDPRHEYDKWYDLIKGDDRKPNPPRRDR